MVRQGEILSNCITTELRDKWMSEGDEMFTKHEIPDDRYRQETDRPVLILCPVPTKANMLLFEKIFAIR